MGFRYIMGIIDKEDEQHLAVDFPSQLLRIGTGYPAEVGDSAYTTFLYEQGVCSSMVMEGYYTQE